MKITPVKGTNDYLPAQAELRNYLQKKICETYEQAGFQRIATPIIEDIENLDKSEGGDNLNLIFKVMKRGEKLKKAIASQNPDNIADMGLRYDLTLPLSRYYANNRASLPQPFKVIQMDRVYRAERPQKGRLREFIQCDIDILGSDSSTCEIELIHTTAKALLNIGINNFKVKINDRRILREILLSVGFEEDQLDSVCISFDKLNKIKAEGVEAELTEKGFDKAVIAEFMKLLSNAPFTLDYVKEICKNSEYVDSLAYIIDTSNALADGKYVAEYDMTLVRGQGYYTGTVFEVESIDFKGAIAGGGRYDNLIGKFLGQQVSAVGFSIGFERIFSILMEHGIDLPNKGNKIAVMYDEGDLSNAYRIAEKYRAEGKICSLYVKPKKMGKFLSKLQERGYAGFINVSNGDEISDFE